MRNLCQRIATFRDMLLERNNKKIINEFDGWKLFIEIDQQGLRLKMKFTKLKEES
jgi:hypothetical protein